MKGLITVLAVLVVFALAFFLYRTPTAPPEMAAAEKAQIQAEIVDVATGINRGFRALDAEAVAARSTTVRTSLSPWPLVLRTECWMTASG